MHHATCTRCRRPLEGAVAARRGMGDVCYRKALDTIRLSDIQLTDTTLRIIPGAAFTLGPDRPWYILMAFTNSRQFADLWKQDFEARFLLTDGQDDTIEIEQIVYWIRTRPVRIKAGDKILEQLSTDALAPTLDHGTPASLAAQIAPRRRRYRVHTKTERPIQDTLF